MALSFNGLEPVAFGGKECTPKINTEVRLRLSQIKEYDANADEVLASAFPDDEEYVLEFLKKKMTTFDKQTLHVYLIGGEIMMQKILDQVGETMKGAMSE